MGANHGLAAVTHNPSGCSLGIIGLGRMGFRIAQKAHAAFKVSILYNDFPKLPGFVKKEVEAHVCEKLHHMLVVTDSVLIATPFGKNKVVDVERVEI